MKKEILMIPFFGWAIARLKPISINRKMKIESLKRVIEVGGARIREGHAILIFPEGIITGIYFKDLKFYYIQYYRW